MEEIEMYGQKRWDSIKFALDFDDTVSLDPEFWGEFCLLVKKFGHSVTVVTSRADDGDTFDIDAFCKHNSLEVIYCSHVPKEECFKADVWLDDSPLAVPSEKNLRRRLSHLVEDRNGKGGW